MTININKVGMFIGATIAVAAGLGAAIVTAKIAIVALAVLALIGAIVFTVFYNRNCSRKLYLEQQWSVLHKELDRVSNLKSEDMYDLSYYKQEGATNLDIIIQLNLEINAIGLEMINTKKPFRAYILELIRVW